MSFLVQNKWYLASFFACYEILVLSIFGIHVFWNFSHSTIAYLILFVVFFSVELLILYQIEKKQRQIELFKSLSFLLTGTVVGILSWFSFSVDFTIFFSYLIAFVFSSFFPTILMYIYSLMNHTLLTVEEMYNITMTNHLEESDESPVFQLENSSGKIILKIKMSNIICFEANDNYVNIHYINKNEEVKRFMERISLRKVEALLPREAACFTRVHKSYIINTEFLEKVTGKSQAYRIHLKGINIEIPVSRSYDITALKRVEVL